MRNEIIVNVFDQTGAVSQAGFGLPLVYDPADDFDYQEVSSPEELDAGVSSIVTEQVTMLFAQEPSPPTVAVYGSIPGAEETVGDVLGALINNGADSWYWLVFASHVATKIEEAADWIAGQERMLAAEFDKGKTAANVVTEMGKYENPRFIPCAHDGGEPQTQQNTHAGIVGRIAPIVPGGYTAKYQTVNTAVPVTFSKTEVSDIIDANCNTYVRSMGVNYFTEGVSSDGSFLDIQVGKDWISARYKEAIFGVLSRAEKVAYDDNGIAQIVSAIKSVNAVAFRNGLIAADEDGEPMVEVSYPRREDTTENDRGERILKEVKSTITIAGAIHNVTVDVYFVL